jgi:hypothetical protein
LAERRQALPALWPELRKRYSKLALPAEVPSAADVLGLVVTSVSILSGWSADGLAVTDLRLLVRYFENPQHFRVVAQDGQGRRREALLPVRVDGDATPEKLMEYLSNAPQLRFASALMAPCDVIVTPMAGGPPLVFDDYLIRPTSQDSLERMADMLVTKAGAEKG